jgi:hypothetical protein
MCFYGCVGARNSLGDQMTHNPVAQRMLRDKAAQRRLALCWASRFVKEFFVDAVKLKGVGMNHVKHSLIRSFSMLLFFALMQVCASSSLAAEKKFGTTFQADAGCKICQDSCSSDNGICQKPCESSNNQCQASCGSDHQCKLKCASVYQKCIGNCIKQRDACWKGCPCSKSKS